MARHHACFETLGVTRNAAVYSALLIAVFALSVPAAAATRVWNNAGGGMWSNAANWTGGVPGASDDADITLAGTYTVLLDVDASIQSFALGGASGMQTLAIASKTLQLAAAPNTSTVGANGALAISGGKVNAGTHAITVDGRLDWSFGTITRPQPLIISASGILAMSDGVMILDGGGTLVNASTSSTWSGDGLLLIDHGDFINSGTLAVSGSPLLDVDQGGFTNDGVVTFSGDPTVYVGVSTCSGAFTNNGTLTKNGSAGTMMVNLCGSSFTNSGLVDVQTGSIIFVDLGSGSNFGSSGAGNTFNAASGASITFGVPAVGPAPLGFRSTTFSGPGTQVLGIGTSQDFEMFGTITSSGLTFANGNLHPGDAVTLVGTLNWITGDISTGVSLTIAAGSTLNVIGNNGGFSVSLCCGPQAFQNFGTVNFQGGLLAVLFSPFAGFWNHAGGQISVNNFSLSLVMQLGTFRNDGVVNLGFPIQVDVGSVTGGATFANSGTVRLNGSKLFMDSGILNDYVQTAGVTDLGGSSGLITMNANSSFDINGGTLKGNGSLGGGLNVTVSGSSTVAPGASPGLIQVSGPYNQAGGTLAVELNGINPGTGYDQIAVSGPIVLGGALSLALGFSPPIGTTFNIISNSGAGAVNGTFAGLPEGATQLVGGTTLKISYVGGDGNDVTLTAIAGATSTVVVPLPNPSVFGQAVTLTATVTGAAPTGTVQFMDGAVDMGAPVPLVSGQAMFVTSTLIAGGHPITAVYSGDAGNLPSTSPVVTQMVNPAATSMAITSALPAVLNAGQSVTVSVVVTANAPGAGTPTGTVAVQDGASPLCTVTLAAAAGSCSAPLNTTGAHTLTASYLATTNFLASTSPPVTVTVNNAIQPTSIPTLGEWVLLALALSLLGNAGFRMRSRGRDMR